MKKKILANLDNFYVLPSMTFFNFFFLFVCVLVTWFDFSTIVKKLQKGCMVFPGPVLHPS